MSQVAYIIPSHPADWSLWQTTHTICAIPSDTPLTLPDTVPVIVESTKSVRDVVFRKLDSQYYHVKGNGRIGYPQLTSRDPIRRFTLHTIRARYGIPRCYANKSAADLYRLVTPPPSFVRPEWNDDCEAYLSPAPCHFLSFSSQPQLDIR